MAQLGVQVQRRRLGLELGLAHRDIAIVAGRDRSGAATLALLAFAVLLLLVDQLLDPFDPGRERVIALGDRMERLDRDDRLVEEVADHEQVGGPELELRALRIIAARQIELLDEPLDLVLRELVLRLDRAPLDEVDPQVGGQHAGEPLALHRIEVDLAVADLEHHAHDRFEEAERGRRPITALGQHAVEDALVEQRRHGAHGLEHLVEQCALARIWLPPQAQQRELRVRLDRVAMHGEDVGVGLGVRVAHRCIDRRCAEPGRELVGEPAPLIGHEHGERLRQRAQALGARLGHRGRGRREQDAIARAAEAGEAPDQGRAGVVEPLPELFGIAIDRLLVDDELALGDRAALGLLDEEHAGPTRQPCRLGEHPVRRAVAAGRHGIHAAEQREPVVVAIEVGPRIERGLVLAEHREQRGSILVVHRLVRLELEADLHRAERRGEPLGSGLVDGEPGHRRHQRAPHGRTIGDASLEPAERLDRDHRVVVELDLEQAECDLLGARVLRLRRSGGDELVGARGGPRDDRLRERLGARALADHAAIELRGDGPLIGRPRDRELREEIGPRGVVRGALR